MRYYTPVKELTRATRTEIAIENVKAVVLAIAIGAGAALFLVLNLS